MEFTGYKNFMRMLISKAIANTSINWTNGFSEMWPPLAMLANYVCIGRIAKPANTKAICRKKCTAFVNASICSSDSQFNQTKSTNVELLQNIAINFIAISSVITNTLCCHLWNNYGVYENTE